MILILRGGILMPIGDFPKSLSQAILVGIMLVGRLGVLLYLLYCTSRAEPSELHTARFQFGANVVIQVLFHRLSFLIRQIIRKDCN